MEKAEHDFNSIISHKHFPLFLVVLALAVFVPLSIAFAVLRFQAMQNSTLNTSKSANTESQTLNPTQNSKNSLTQKTNQDLQRYVQLKNKRVKTAQEIGGDINGQGGMPDANGHVNAGDLGQTAPGVTCYTAGCFNTTGQQVNPNGTPYAQGGGAGYQGQTQTGNNQANGTVGGQGGNVNTAALSNCTTTADQSGLDAEEVNFITLLNQYRASKGLGAVTSSSILSGMAAWMANDMSGHNYLAHEPDSAGRDHYTRAANCGVTESQRISEILDGGTNYSAANVSLTAFENEPGHNAVLIDPALIKVGVARSYNATSANSWYWAVDFVPYNDGTTATVLPATTATATPVPGGATATPIPVGGATATPIPVVATATPVPSPATLAISVFLPGIGTTLGFGQTASPTQSAHPATVSIFDSSNNPGQKLTVPLTYDATSLSFKGSATITNIASASGAYDIKIKLDNTLTKDAGTVQLTQGQSSSASATLISGDVNGDNSLDLQDYNALLTCYGNSNCGQNTNLDLNLDGQVDELDLNIFYNALAKRTGD